MKTRARGKGVTMHVISNSHWDREWLLSFRQLQVRLVDVMDQLLEVMENDPSYRYFTLDGQTVPIEDYLEIRPENAERLGKLISGGRIIVGPWFILAHHSLCTGEAIVRNLLRGCRITKKMGGKIGAGYTPGSFGQISQLPQLYAGVGIDNIIFYRGINSFIMPDSEFTWEGADGTRALGYHFPESFSRVAMYIKMRTVFENCKAPDDLDYTPRGKEFPAHLCDEESVGGFYETLNQKMTEKFDKQKALEALLELRDGLAKAAKAPHLWFGWGFDHSYIDYFTPRLIELMQPLLGDDRLVHSNLLKFIESVKKDIKGKRLKTMKGEMRHTNKEGTICYLSPHVISSRMDLKLANARAERMLFRQAEPAATMAYLCGADYPAPFLNLAERQILLNQAHDSICGCSIDQVPRDMHYRYEQCFGLSGEITRRSVFHIVEKIDYSGVAEGDVPITVFNTLAQKRSCIVRAAIDVPMKKGYLKEFELVDERGRVVPVQPIHTEDKRLLIMAKYNMPPRIDVERHHIYFAAEDVPSMGYKSYVARVRVKARKTFWQRELKEHKPTLVKAPNTMENEFLRVEITPKGTVNMLHKETGKRFTGMHYFEDGGDLGEGWNYVPPARDEVVSSLGQSARISLVEDGPLCARYRVETEVLAPASGSRGENARSAERKAIGIASEITLRAGSRRLEFKTTVDNTCRDHRLRVRFPSDIEASDSFADGQFDVVKRPIKVPDRTGWKEPAPAEHPQQAFVDVTDGAVGLAVLNDGIPEYEVTDDARRTIALTLLRCVGPSIGDDETEDEAQLPGRHEFRYALYPHAGGYEDADVPHEALDFRVPLKICLSRRHEGTMPMSMSMFSVSPKSLVVTGTKKCEDRKSVMVRLYNSSTKVAAGRLRWHKPLKGCYNLDLLEKRKEKIATRGRGASFRAGPKQIITLEVLS